MTTIISCIPLALACTLRVMDTKTVKKVASLARLSMSDQELESYRPKLENILKFVEQLSEVNTDGVEPLSNVVDIALTLRADTLTDGDLQQKILANAPESTEGFFVVPKVVE